MDRGERSLKALITSIAVLTVWIGATAFLAGRSPAKSFAQKMVEEIVAKNSEVSGAELGTTPPNKQNCETIATTDAGEMGETCDKDDVQVMTSGKPSVEKGSNGAEITVPLHDAAGTVIGFMSMDFKAGSGQKDSDLLARAEQMVHEVESQIPSKAKLFESGD